MEAATTAIEQALTVRRLRALWSDTAPGVAGLLGARYAGLDSDWSSIEAALDALAAADREFPRKNPPFTRSSLTHSFLLAWNTLRALCPTVSGLSTHCGATVPPAETTTSRRCRSTRDH